MKERYFSCRLSAQFVYHSFALDGIKPRKIEIWKILICGLDIGPEWTGLHLRFRSHPSFIWTWARWAYFCMDWTGWTNFDKNMNGLGWTGHFLEWTGPDGLLKTPMGLLFSLEVPAPDYHLVNKILGIFP